MWRANIETTAEIRGHVVVLGCDPGPTHSAFALLNIPFMKMPEPGARVLGAWYLPNGEVWKTLPKIAHDFLLKGVRIDAFAYESCGCQGSAPGESTFETAAMGGEARAVIRPHVHATYSFSPDRWRYALCGHGNAKDHNVAEGLRALFPATGGGADPTTGTKSRPGPLWALREAGAGGNAVHLRDAVGVAVAPLLIRFRSGIDPERFRRTW